MSFNYQVVVCGSFHRKPHLLKDELLELEQTQCKILSPLTVKFSSLNEDFVRSNYDEGFSNIELERFHLRTIAQADFIWLYAPDGYIGSSTTFELGYAHALHKLIYSYTEPSEEYIRSIVKTTSSVFSAINSYTTS